MLRLLVRTILENELGTRVVEAGTSERALGLARRRNFDLVISDIGRSGMNGLKFLQVFKKEHPGIPVMIISGSLNAATWRRAQRLGACCGLAKPFDAMTMLNAVAGALRGCRGGSLQAVLPAGATLDSQGQEPWVSRNGRAAFVCGD